jgi:hypothetical protein
MAEYTITTTDANEAILTWLAKGADNAIVLQALVDQKLSEYAAPYRDSGVTAVKEKLDYAMKKEELKKAREDFLAAVEAEMAKDAGETPVEEGMTP